MRLLALAATLVVVLAAFAGLGFAVRSFDRHQGLPSHLDVGTQWGHVVPGESDVVLGHALDAKPGTKLLLDAQPAPYDHAKWRVIASTDQIGPGGAYRFVVRPRVRTHYKVITAVDHQDASRVVAVIVDRRPAAKRG